jgi:hypothetical protein
MEKNYTVKIDHARKEIVVSKELAKKASVYGSEEYNFILALKRDNAGYDVVTRNTTSKKSAFDKITINDMRAYIKKHDPDGVLISKFEAMVNEEKGDNLMRTSFFAIKKWFFEQYPDLKAKAA